MRGPSRRASRSTSSRSSSATSGRPSAPSSAADAPDVVVGAHDWTGELAASGLLLPLNPPAAVKKNIPGYALDAFSYGTAVKRLYGAPVAIENIGLFVNTKLAKVPTTCAQLEQYALAVQEEDEGAGRHRRPAGRKR